MNDRTRFIFSAVVAAVLFSIGYAIVVVLPGGGTVADEEFLAFYTPGRSFFLPFMLVLVLLAGSWALVWFFSELRARLPEQVLSQTAYGVALVGAAALAVGGAILFAPSGVQMNAEVGFVGVPVAHAFAQAGLGVMLAIGMYSLALAVALFSLSLRRANLVPSWLSITGIVIAVLLLGSYIWAPGYLLPIWVVLVGIIGARQDRAVEGASR